MLQYVKKSKVHTLKHVFIMLGIVVSLLSVIFIKNTILAASTDKQVASIPATVEDPMFTGYFTGDSMLGRHVEEVIQRKGVSYLLQDFTEKFKTADYVSTNLENPIIETADHYEKDDFSMIHLYVKDEHFQQLPDHGFTLFNMANNHMMDYQEEGLIHTIDQLEKGGTAYVGAGLDRNAAESIHFEEINGINVATLGFTDVYSKGASAQVDKPGIANTKPRRMIRQIGLADRQADLTIVQVHWGEEYNVMPTERQRQLAEAMAEAGADIIIGHHPHVLQPVEMIGDTVVFYSLGNFIFDQGWSKTRESAVVKLEIDDAGVGHFMIEPILVKDAAPRTLNKTEGLYRKKIYTRLFRDTELDVEKESNYLSFRTQLLEGQNEF